MVERTHEINVRDLGTDLGLEMDTLKEENRILGAIIECLLDQTRNYESTISYRELKVALEDPELSIDKVTLPAVLDEGSSDGIVVWLDYDE